MREVILGLGDLAYLESAFSGLVPIKLVGLGEYLVGLDMQQYLVKVTSNYGSYRKGEYLSINSCCLIPRNMVKTRSGQKWIMPHKLTVQIEED